MTTLPLMPQLRAILDKAEPYALVYSVHTDGARTLIHYLDTITALEAACTTAGLDIEAERVRIAALDGRVRHDAERIMHALGSSGTPVQTGYVEQLAELADQRRRSRIRRRTLLGTLITAIILGFAYLVITAPPSADIPAITTAAIDGDTARAYSIAQRELRTFPNDPELLLWLSVLAETTGDVVAADSYWQQTRSASENSSALPYERGNTRLLAKNIPAAQASVAELLATQITIPEGLFLKAAIAEAQGNVREAIRGFEEASQAADAANRQEMVALIRIRMGGLMRFGIEATPTKTP